jgi:hypothetical protein
MPQKKPHKTSAIKYSSTYYIILLLTDCESRDFTVFFVLMAQVMEVANSSFELKDLDLQSQYRLRSRLYWLK